MAKVRTIHRCRECGAMSPRWLGRCPECEEWGSLVEESDATAASGAGVRTVAVLPAGAERPVPITAVDPVGATVRSTGIGELDRVLGGGLVPGSVTLIGGEPGMGKSTLLLQALGDLARRGVRCLLVCAEESCEQVRLRAQRLGALSDGLLVVADTMLPNLIAYVTENEPQVLAVDSIQTVFDPESPGTPGSPSQVRACAQQLVRLAKDRSITTLLVGHVTKDGNLAGPRLLEHIVDTVLQFEGDRHHALRMLHALKHRFGSTQELGLFEMRESGLFDVADPSELFLADRRLEATGSVVTAVLEGARPLLVEVQALVAPTPAPMPRRSAQGLDAGRLSLLLAVLEQRAGLSVVGADVYASVAGGVRVNEAGADLATALAVASAHVDRPVASDTVVIGEVGLGGELRQVQQTGRRLSEAARLGFRRAIGPPSTPEVESMVIVRCATLSEALAAAGLVPGD